MTATPDPSSFAASHKVPNSSQGDLSDGVRKNPAESAADWTHYCRRYFASLLWRAFPARSEEEVANQAAGVLDVSPRQVKNWLRCEHSAAFHYVLAVMSIAGAEIVFRKIEGSDR